jgi:hypothetical protein
MTMIEVLYCSYITDEVNDNSGFNFQDKFANAENVSLVFTLHQGADSPSTAGVKAQLVHCDTENGIYEPIPNAILYVMGPGSQASDIVTLDRSVFNKPFGRIQLLGIGIGDPAGAGSVTAVW